MSNIDRRKVSSSNIREIAYESATQTLEITFESGGSYLYRGVSPDVFQRLTVAPSLGRMFHTEIRDQFPHEKGSLEADQKI